MAPTPLGGPASKGVLGPVLKYLSTEVPYDYCHGGQRSYKADFTAVTQALQVAVIEPTSSELDNELGLTICWVCFFLPKPMIIVYARF